MNLIVLRKPEQITSSWSGGTTTQLFIYPENASYQESNFFFRISTATVDAEESVFTKLPGVTRKIMVLEGTLKLEHKGKYTKTLHKFETDAFSGDWETRGFGKVTDFNLMTTGKMQGSLLRKTFKENESINFSTVNPDHFIGLYNYKGKTQIEVGSNFIILETRDFLSVNSDKEIVTIKIRALESAELIVSKIQLL
jgi:environmental stress-induced protein Ves